MNYHSNLIILILAGTTVAIPAALAIEGEEYKDKEVESSKIAKTTADQSSDSFFTSGNPDTNKTWEFPDRTNKYLVSPRSYKRDPVIIITSSRSGSVVTAGLTRVKTANFGTVPLNNNFTFFGKVAFSAEENDNSPKATFGEISESEKNGTEMTFVVGAKYNF